MYLALWLIRRWRLPATPALILPVAVSLKRFFAPDLVFSFGISRRGPKVPSSSKRVDGSPWHAFGQAVPKGAAHTRKAPRRQAGRRSGLLPVARLLGPGEHGRPGRRGEQRAHDDPGAELALLGLPE